jgi:fumarate hydratase subunit alpha
MMRSIDSQSIVERVARAVQQINADIAPPILDYFMSGLSKSQNIEKQVLEILIKNADIAKTSKIPLCQDTGLVVVFAKMGIEVSLAEPLRRSIDRGVAQGYEEGYLRKSMVRDPLFDRTNTGDNTPATLHIELVPGDQLELTIIAKGGGSENASALNMFTPSDDEDLILDWVVGHIRQKGQNACPPLIIGLGIGGDFEQCAQLAKRALNRPIGQRNSDERYAAFELKIHQALNNLDLGAGGYGGRLTAMDVFIESAPCHIASKPVALNVGCHSTRHSTVIL